MHKQSTADSIQTVLGLLGNVLPLHSIRPSSLAPFDATEGGVLSRDENIMLSFAQITTTGCIMQSKVEERVECFQIITQLPDCAVEDALEELQDIREFYERFPSQSQIQKLGSGKPSRKMVKATIVKRTIGKPIPFDPDDF